MKKQLQHILHDPTAAYPLIPSGKDKRTNTISASKAGAPQSPGFRPVLYSPEPAPEGRKSAGSPSQPGWEKPEYISPFEPVGNYLHRDSWQNLITPENANQRFQEFMREYTATYTTAAKNLTGMDLETAKQAGFLLQADSWSIAQEDAALRRYLEDHKDQLDPTSYNDAINVLNQYRNYWGQLADAYSRTQDFASKFGSEDYYSYVMAQDPQWRHLLLVDTRTLEQEKNRTMEALDEWGLINEPIVNWQDSDEVEIYNQYVEGEMQKIADMEKLLNQAEYVQKGFHLSNAALNAADFDQWSGYQSTESQTWWDRVTSQYGMGYDDLAYEYINNRDGIRDEIDDQYLTYSRGGLLNDGVTEFSKKGYDLLMDYEIAIYNYYYAKEGKEAAEEYLNTLQESLNLRKAGIMFSALEGQTAKELLFAVPTGFDQFGSGLSSAWQGITGTADYIPATPTEIAAGMVREDLGGVGFKLPDALGGASLGQVGFDTISATTNMLPSIALAAAGNVIVPGSGAYIGSTLMGVSAGGHGYQQMLNQGYSREQARAYAKLVGASEAGLNYLLGGIGKLGGKLSEQTIQKILTNVDNALLRAGVEFAGRLGSEFTEEYLQQVLTPWYYNIALNADEDIDLLDPDVLYSGLIGLLSASVWNTGGMAINGLTGKSFSGTPEAPALPLQQGLPSVELSLKNAAPDLLQNPPLSVALDLTQEEALQFVTEHPEYRRIIQEQVESGVSQETAETQVAQVFLEAVQGAAPRAASEAAVNPGTQKTTPEPPSQTGLSQDGQTLQPPGNPALLTADPNTIADSVASTATDSIINTSDITEGVQPPGTGENAVALDDTPTPEQQIALLAAGIGQQRGVTSGRATIAAQEMYTEAEKRFGSDRNAVLPAYQPGQNPKQFLDGFQNAYIAGTLGNPNALADSKAVAYLTEEQKEVAFELGVQATEHQDVQEIAGESNLNTPGKRSKPKPGVANSPKSATMVDERGRLHEAQLMALPIPERATEIEKLLGYYTDKKSKWSGNTLVKTVDEMGEARGRKLWTCNIEVRENAGIKTLIHELLHARSASTWNPLAYSRWQLSEEAAVELFAREICKSNGIAYDSAYTKEVKQLEIARDILMKHDNPFDFAKEFFEVDMLRRYDWLRKKADLLIERKVLSSGSVEALNRAVEMFRRMV